MSRINEYIHSNREAVRGGYEDPCEGLQDIFLELYDKIMENEREVVDGILCPPFIRCDQIKQTFEAFGIPIPQEGK